MTRSEGTATSPTFKVNSKYIDFLVGGGNHPHNPNTSQTPAPGDLLFPGAALNPPNPGVTTYEQLGWTATGGLVNQPVPTGSIGGQQYVSGFQAYSTGLINTFVSGSDVPQGTLTSPAFTITQPYINFLIGGGDNPYPGSNATAVLLLVNGKVVRSATGQDNELLNWVAWDVSQFAGQTHKSRLSMRAQVAGATSTQTNSWVPTSPALPTSTETTVNLVVDGKIVRSATGQNSAHLQWVSWNVAEFAGRDAQIEIIDYNTGADGWGHLFADEIVFSDVAKEVANWIDYGRDFYAVNSWNNLPDNQRRWIAWMNNWDYGGSIPTSPWRSAMSIPREVRLETLDEKVQLVQKPIPELSELRQGESCRSEQFNQCRHYCSGHPRQGVGDHRRVQGRHSVPVRLQGTHRFRRRDARGLRRAGGTGLRGSDQVWSSDLQQPVPKSGNCSIISREWARETAHLRRLVLSRGFRRRWTGRHYRSDLPDA